MKQTSILAVRAAAAALAAVLLPLAAEGQGSTTTAIPDCVLQCRPWILEQTTTDCETDCLANEVDVEFQLAAASGDPYIPRFSLPSCGGGQPCPYGAETFTYKTGDTIQLGAGLWSTTTSFWLGSSGAVVQAEFYVAPIGSIVGVDDTAQLPWKSLPPAHFDPIEGFWRVAWDTTTYDDPAGYLLRVDLVDALLGTVNAFTLGVDPGSCGFHTYGELVGGANTLELSATGEACPGKTAVLTTKQTSASEVYTSIALGGDYVPILLGTVYVDLTSQVLLLKTATAGGVAQEVVTFPTTPGLSGLSVYGQSLAFDAGAPLGIAFSNALRIDFCSCP